LLRRWIPSLSRFTIPCESRVELGGSFHGCLKLKGNLSLILASMILKWMFPGGKSLPHVIVSHNARFDPVRTLVSCTRRAPLLSPSTRTSQHYHLKIGAALRPLRQCKTLLIGSGGAVHNLYRNNWHQVIMYRDNLAQERPPEQWAIDFGEAFSDVITNNTGPALRRGLARLMQHPQYRDAVRANGMAQGVRFDADHTFLLAARNR
jgi:hypothetical protein